MEEEKGLANIAVGLCVIGCIVAGVTAIFGGILAIKDHNDFIGAGICLASAALCFGVIMFALLRK